MYNRYIPQPDGSFRHSRHPDQPPRQINEAPPPPPAQTEPVHSILHEPERPKPRRNPSPPPASRLCPRQNRTEEDGVFTFLRQLLPKNFDSGDLLVIILLLLMCGDCPEDQNTALLTLALYLFL